MGINDITLTVLGCLGDITLKLIDISLELRYPVLTINSKTEPHMF